MKARKVTPKPTRWPTCNFLEADAAVRKLWQFATSGAHPQLSAETSYTAGQTLPDDVGPRTWRSLFQKRLNVAWLPSNRVFLRVATVPKCDPAELPAMLELQLEKVSPLPVTQIVWSFEPLPCPDETGQTVLFIVAERSVVEEHLGLLEKGGYQADRLELPLVHRVATHKPDSDGIWIHLAPESGRMLGLAVWWYGGALRQVNVLQLPDSDQGPQLLTALLHRLTWAAQFEGWLPATPAWHFVVDPAVSPVWEKAFRDWAGNACTTEPALSQREIAQLAARRHSRGEARADLLPPEYASRYRLQTIDRLWMQGLGSLLAVYLLGVAAYFAAARYEAFRNNRVATQVTQLAPGYTNALNLRERLRILQEQSGLKFAALESWKLVSELLPAEVTLDSFNFQGGEKLFVGGSVPIASQSVVNDFNTQLRRLRVGNQLMFEDNGVETPRFTLRGDQYHWDFTAKLRITWLE